MLRKACLEAAGNWNCTLTDSKNLQSGKESTLQIYMKLKHIIIFIVLAASVVVAASNSNTHADIGHSFCQI